MLVRSCNGGQVFNERAVRLDRNIDEKVPSDMSIHGNFIPRNKVRLITHPTQVILFDADLTLAVVKGEPIIFGCDPGSAY